MSTIQRCTWEGCAQPGTHPHVGQYGNTFACLCDAHHHVFETTEDDFLHDRIAPGQMLNVWAKAKGGVLKMFDL